MTYRPEPRHLYADQSRTAAVGVIGKMPCPARLTIIAARICCRSRALDCPSSWDSPIVFMLCLYLYARLLCED